MTITIINEPEEARDYEFIVAMPLNPIDDTDRFLFMGMYENGYYADMAAERMGGIVIHNVRIQGRRK